MLVGISVTMHSVGNMSNDEYDYEDYNGSTDCIHAMGCCPECDCSCEDGKEDPKCYYHHFEEYHQ